MTESDVIIVGGGVVGLTLACLLGQAKMKVVVLERQPFDGLQTQTSLGNPVSAINQASLTLLHSVGAWKRILSTQKTPYYHMRVWERSGSGVIQFDAVDVGKPNLGHIVENKAMVQALYLSLLELPSVRVCAPSQVRLLADCGIFYEHQGQEQWVRAPLVIGADGAFSWVREAAGISVQERSYHQTAIVATVTTEKPHAATAWQRFLPTGPLAFLPLSSPNKSSIVWSAETALAGQLMALEGPAFCQALGSAFGYTLGQILGVAHKKSHPLVARHATAYVKPGLALLGDAIHTIHPLAGQGLNMGLLDAKVLANTLLEAHKRGEPMGHCAVLRRYERQQKGVHLGMLALMEGFNRIFSNDVLLAVLLRNQGLSLVNQLPFVKKWLAEQAAGAITTDVVQSEDGDDMVSTWIRKPKTHVEDARLPR